MGKIYINNGFEDAAYKLYKKYIELNNGDEDTIEGINCLSIKAVGNNVEMCGLNGHQLAVLQIEHESLAQTLPQDGILIHKKYITELKKMIPETEIDICQNHLYTRPV